MQNNTSDILFSLFQMTFNLKASVFQEFRFIVKKKKKKCLTSSNIIHMFFVISITRLKLKKCNTIHLILYFLHLKIHSSCRVSSVLPTFLSIDNSVVMNSSTIELKNKIKKYQSFDQYIWKKNNTVQAYEKLWASIYIILN